MTTITPSQHSYHPTMATPRYAVNDTAYTEREDLDKAVKELIVNPNPDSYSVLVGPRQSGKTTTIQIATALLRATYRRIEYCDMTTISKSCVTLIAKIEEKARKLHREGSQYTVVFDNVDDVVTGVEFQNAIARTRYLNVIVVCPTGHLLECMMKHISWLSHALAVHMRPFTWREAMKYTEERAQHITIPNSRIAEAIETFAGGSVKLLNVFVREYKRHAEKTLGVLTRRYNNAANMWLSNVRQNSIGRSFEDVQRVYRTLLQTTVDSATYADTVGSSKHYTHNEFVTLDAEGTVKIASLYVAVLIQDTYWPADHINMDLFIAPEEKDDDEEEEAKKKGRKCTTTAGGGGTIEDDDATVCKTIVEE